MFSKGNAAYYIDDDGLEHSIEISVVDRYIAEGKYTVKVEGLEDHIDVPMIITQPYTVHAYIAPAGARSFPTHQDPYPVFIHVVEGIKTMEIDGEAFHIYQGETMLIDTNVPHRALNTYASIMLSIGVESAKR